MNNDTVYRLKKPRGGFMARNLVGHRVAILEDRQSAQDYGRPCGLRPRRYHRPPGRLEPSRRLRCLKPCDRENPGGFKHRTLGCIDGMSYIPFDFSIHAEHPVRGPKPEAIAENLPARVPRILLMQGMH